MNKQQTQNYQKLAEEASNRQIPEKKMQEPYVAPVQPSSPSSQPLVANNVSYGQPTPSVTPYILEISQPNYNSPFDVIPLPSLGKTYRNKKPNVRLGYMTTADENILTSPNLLQSGEFLNVLINRKILEPDLRYNDLLVGDRNAIMIWLRATGYGEMYPVTLLDENGDAFDTELNLNELKTKELGAEPDDEGLFDYTFKLARAQVKFKLLTCVILTLLVSREKENGVLIDNTTTYTLEKRIVEINGSRDKHTIKEFSNVIRVQDGKDFNKYLDMVEPGIDLNITVGTQEVVPLIHFFHLTSAFFAFEYKVSLLEEIYLCTQHLDGFGYSDVLLLPVYERRFYLNLKLEM
jgi:hypothetical protein